MPKKEKQGVVSSNKMDKTVVVKVAEYRQHPKYKKIIEHVLSLESYMTIFPLQDVLKLDGKARMNLPGTCGYPNWAWRLKSFDELKKIKFKIK